MMPVGLTTEARAALAVIRFLKESLYRIEMIISAGYPVPNLTQLGVEECLLLTARYLDTVQPMKPNTSTETDATAWPTSETSSTERTSETICIDEDCIGHNID